MNLAKKIFSLLICGALSFSAFAFIPQASLSADAATLSQINASSVFVKQQKSDTCTLASNVMMLRRAALMRGDSDWSSITESACRSTLWYEGVGMWHEYTYKNITVKYNYSVTSTTQLINALKEHPEGIVVYDTSYPHAILLTDYTNGEFYCADPANNVPSGRIKVSQSLINISDVDTYWYVSSPDVKLDNNETPSNPTFSEQWKITSSNGVNMRSGAGTSYSILGAVPCNTVLTVTQKKVSDGYTWGYTVYDGKKGWVVLDYAVLISQDTGKSLAISSSISSQYVTLGNSIIVSASAEGGLGDYKYAFYSRKSGESSWKTLRNYGSIQTVPFKPDSTGKYEICAKVKDSSGNVSKEYFTLTVKSEGLTNNSSVSSQYVTLGNSVLITARASGGESDYTYAYYYKKSTESSWTQLKWYSSVNTIPLKPESEGSYDICVKAKDKNGTIAKQYFSLTVNAENLVNNSTISSNTIKLGNSITINAKASGGTSSSYKYAYYYKKPTDSSWNVIKGYTSNTKVSFKPDDLGLYNICIKVKDEDGTIANQYYNLTVK